MDEFCPILDKYVRFLIESVVYKDGCSELAAGPPSVPDTTDTLADSDGTPGPSSCEATGQHAAHDRGHGGASSQVCQHFLVGSGILLQ